jgi:hypothetical protein
MRYLTLALLLASALFGQTRPPSVVEVIEPEPAQPSLPQLRLSPWEKPEQPAYKKWRLFPFGKPKATPPTNFHLFPDLKLGAPPAARRTPKLYFKQPQPQKQPCAIPLTNALPSFGPAPEIRHVPIPNTLLPMKEVPPLAPSCDDRK